MSTTTVGSISKLTAIELENFMSIEKARIEFDDTGIINLCGYNDSGKSAVTRALEVIFYNAYVADQVNFIQDNKPYFGIGLEFSDGVSINRYKYSDGKSVWEMFKGDEVVFTNRLADGIAAMSDTPEVITKYLGVVEDDATGEKLNVRRNTDKLFLINTTGGENYKIINSVLRADILAETVRRMNADLNTLQAELANQATSSKTLKAQLENLAVVEEEVLQDVKEKTQKLADIKRRYEYLQAIKEQKELLESIEVFDELPLIDTTRLNEITNIIELQKATETPIYPECDVIDTSRLSLLEEIIQLRESLNVVIPPELPLIDTERYRDVVEAGQRYNDLYHATHALNSTTAEYEEVRSELARLSQEHGFKICQNCGAVAV